MVLTIAADFAALIWIYLIIGRGDFWLAAIRDGDEPPAPAAWPSVAVVIPARNEAALIGASVRSLLRQDYPGVLTLTVVDDDSSDGTAAAACAAIGDRPGFGVVANRGLPPGWTGKLWAVHQGIAAARQRTTRPDYFLLTDADIVHAPDALRRLVARASSGGYVLTSLLARLRCESFAERVHMPAFVFFFQMLFPFSWVCRADRATAAAAGGCMLVRADALRRSGGIERIKGALIDDCALAKQLKACGPIWLGLSERVQSLRGCAGFAAAARMVARTAYAQLRHSPFLLALTILALVVTFIVPVFAALFGAGPARYPGIAAWGLMTIALQPTLRFYRMSPLWGVALPAIAALYALYTLNSAYRHLRKRGGLWKGRVYAGALHP